MNPDAEQPKMDASVTSEQQPQSDRPAWLPEGFDTPEQLAEAYLASKKTGEESQDSKQPQATPDEAASVAKISKYSEEFFKTGSLSDKSYKELTELGYPKSVVDQFIAGQKAVLAAEESQVFASVGGKESYDSLIQWAGANLSKEEVDAYNQSVESGNMSQVMFAVKGLQARYANANKTEPKLLGGSGRTAPAAFTSVAQVVAAMSDPKYKTDPAYRAEVERKIANSNVL
jgi:hypothetical protein